MCMTLRCNGCLGGAERLADEAATEDFAALWWEPGRFLVNEGICVFGVAQGYNGKCFVHILTCMWACSMFTARCAGQRRGYAAFVIYSLVSIVIS